MDIDEIADQLYGLAPEEFTAARDQAAREAASAADKKAVKALRKPTAAAHEINRLTRARPDDVDSLLGLGAELRAAMGGDPTEVRRLTEQRRDLIGSLVARDLPAQVQQDVTATLEAATADPDLGAAVRSGRLVKPLRYAGFGAVPDLGDALATPLRVVRAGPSASPPSPPPSPGRAPAKPPAGKAAKAPAPLPPKPVPESAPDLTAARNRVLELAGIADDAQRRYDQAAKSATEARAALERAETERAGAHKAAREAHKDAERARRDLGRLERS